jgi:phage terminase large subunit-like protein
MMDAVTQYAWNVLNTDYGKMCGKPEKQACERHLRDMERAENDPEFPWVFDWTRVERIIRHFANIPRVDVAGEMIELEPWQIFDYGNIFGWVERETGKRKYDTALIENPRGHAKTTMAAGIGLYFMTGDALYPPGKPREAVYELQPEINIVAVDKFQGRKAREDMATMAETSAALSKRLSVKRSYIRHKKRGGEVVVFSKDKKNKDGGRPSLVITEEYHLHPDSTQHDAARQGMGKRAQCLDLIITTAGENCENNPCYRDHLQYLMILDGRIIQENVFVMIRTIDEGDDPHDESCWYKANAFFRHGSDYGKQLYSRVKNEYNDAYANNDPTKIRKFLIKRLDCWQADSENKYFSGCMDRFKALEVPADEFRELTRGIPGYYGFDLSKTTDLTGAAWCGKLPDGRIAVSVMGFIPQNRAEEHRRSDRIPYLEWAKDGYVVLTPGDVVDNAYVEDYIYTCESETDGVGHANGRTAVEVDYDGYNATDMALRMRTHYNSEEKIVEIPQTCAALNLGTKRFRELVLQDALVAEYSPLFEWCLNNAVEQKNQNDNIKLSKRHKDDTQRIDPVAALMNAMTRLIVAVDNKVDVNKAIEDRGYVFD